MGIYLNGTTAYTLYKSETVKPYFIDKTLMLEQLFPLVNEGNNYICITRPRRFGKTVTASSESGEKAANVVDGSSTSRWQAQDSTDDQWIQVDLGSVKSVNTVAIDWEGAYAQKYQIQVSTDGENWDTVANVSGKVAKITTQFAAVKARYVKFQGVERGTGYGYSIWEMQVLTK